MSVRNIFTQFTQLIFEFQVEMAQENPTRKRAGIRWRKPEKFHSFWIQMWRMWNGSNSRRQIYLLWLFCRFLFGMCAQKFGHWTTWFKISQIESCEKKNQNFAGLVFNCRFRLSVSQQLPRSEFCQLRIKVIFYENYLAILTDFGQNSSSFFILHNFVHCQLKI